ncbi:CDP-alcohol phosphatidyltransferase family protein [candidate division KSB1 bacterium]|nr:CDP-alcohol phosphatidyltransferase family protein [candidate division KSB1 bacterium]MBL7094345.1 CDP-alcohol phosphatidyltransferase family protein [candidate division KSB1 bacterium]
MKKEFFNWPRLQLFVGKNFSFLSPMTWTWISLILAIAGFFVITFQYVYWGFTLFLLSTLVDAIDGRVARYQKNATYIGAFADGVIDRFVDALIIMSYFYFELPSWGLDINILLFLLLFATLIPPFIVAYANHRHAVPDPTEKVIWRFAFRIEYLVLFIAAIFFYPISPTVTLILIYVSFVLNWATVIQSLILTFIKAKNYDQKNPSDEY